MPYIIRTSDRGMFKQCRQKWDFGSKIRQNYEPLISPEVLDFGTVIHAALEKYYDPETWSHLEVQQARALAEFHKSMDAWQSQYLTVIRSEAPPIHVEIKHDEFRELGDKMLRHYFKWAPSRDKNLKPLKTEIEFEIPIPVPMAYRDLVRPGRLVEPFSSDFSVDGNGYLRYKGEPVVYQGRIDALFEDLETGMYWIMDHKTAAQFGQYAHLQLDEQCGSYVWALFKMLSLNVDGVLYNQLRKKAPHEPRVLKNGDLSVAKNQDTTYDIFVEAVHANGQDVRQYADFLEYLKENPKEFVRRIQVFRNQRELAVLERRICQEAIEMLDNPIIYPNPGLFNCNGCQFFNPCLAQQEQGDVQFILQELFRKRAADKEPALEVVTE